MLRFTLIFGTILSISAHSWIECSNYLLTSEADRNYWDASKCLGYPRCSASRNGVFGSEGSLNYQSVNDTSCQCNRGSDNEYTTTYPKATYQQGQRVCLAYPSKNHVADLCTSQYIPDNGMVIYRSELGATSDPPLEKWPFSYPNTNGEHTNGQIDYKGFQNCPKFCEDMPNAFCSVCFDLEPDLDVGTYTFHWEWLFNIGQGKYISCWEADVVASSSGPTPSMLPMTTVAPGTSNDENSPTPAPASSSSSQSPSTQAPQSGGLSGSGTSTQAPTPKPAPTPAQVLSSTPSVQVTSSNPYLDCD
ncbi:hypothetical protein THRCLA_09690 [Thraustotheca clavata]|uniref:Secreted protein n=1 Tax=Thraustotheca clavata TaxID=74557 RepID=A0A0A7CMK2_9STRA|nr:secreted protein [Thraustotheca clavata]OQR89560.1 hypothetical protein THRCLA_09690 [Thraustotheca clavata]